MNDVMLKTMKISFSEYSICSNNVLNHGYFNYIVVRISLGCCNPRYMRATMYTVPCSNDLLGSVRVPMGLIIQPMATVKSNEVCMYRSTTFSVFLIYVYFSYLCILCRLYAAFLCIHVYVLELQDVVMLKIPCVFHCDCYYIATAVVS